MDILGEMTYSMGSPYCAQ